MNSNIRDRIRNDTVMFEYDVHDLPRAAAWYQDVLGLEMVFRGGDCHAEFALPVPGARLALSRAGTEKPIQKAARLFLRTDDLDGVAAALNSKGVKTGPLETVEGVVRILWVEDPEGNHFAIEQWMGEK
ncbi:MAG: VOC family protein [Anaerolineales bacterium]|nr:VOC family protein [Anaerolineales bacterium]